MKYTKEWQILDTSSSNHRAEAPGNWPIAGDEHAVPVLVLLPEGPLQQEDVRGVQAAGGGGWKGGLQVGCRPTCVPPGDGGNFIHALPRGRLVVPAAQKIYRKYKYKKTANDGNKIIE